MTKFRIKCEYSQSGSFCPERRCPLENKGYNDALEIWAWIGRACKASSPEPSPGGGYDPELGMLRKCRINSLFDEGQIVLYWLLGNKGRMTPQLCAELIRGERRFKQMRRKERQERKEELANEGL